MIVRERLLLIGLFTCVLTAPACFSLGPAEESAVILYHLDPEPEPWVGTPIPAALALRPFSANAVLDHEGIRYRANDIEGGYWLDRRWCQSPATMIQEAVAHDLEAAGLFRQMLLADNAGRADFLLGATVHRLDQEDRSEGWFAVVEITFDVIRAKDGTPVWHERIRREELAADQTVTEVVRGLNRALVSVMGRLREALSAHCR